MTPRDTSVIVRDRQFLIDLDGFVVVEKSAIKVVPDSTRSSPIDIRHGKLWVEFNSPVKILECFVVFLLVAISYPPIHVSYRRLGIDLDCFGMVIYSSLELFFLTKGQSSSVVTLCTTGIEFNRLGAIQDCSVNVALKEVGRCTPRVVPSRARGKFDYLVSESVCFVWLSSFL